MGNALGRTGCRRAALLLVMSLLAATAGAARVDAARFAVTAKDDAVAASGAAGSERALVVRPGAPAYVRFRVPARAARIVRAQLVMRTTAGSRGGVAIVRPVRSGWTERTVVRLPAPAPAGPARRARIAGGVLALDVTRHVLPGRHAAFSVRSVGGRLVFTSREARTAALRPQLVVTWADGTVAPLGPGPARTPRPAPNATDERFSATPDHAFVGPDGRPVLMNGANTRDAVSPGNPWTYSRANYATLRAGGFNSVRIPLDWNDFETAPGVFSAASLATLDTTIANAKAAGLHVILDPLHLKGGDRLANVPAWALRPGDDSISVVQREAGRWIALVAQRYGREQGVVAVDLVNEAKPASGLRNDRLVVMYDTLIDAYRAHDPDKILILEAQGGDASMQGGDYGRISNRRNLVWSIHFYYAGGSDDDGYSSAGWVTGHETWDGSGGYPVRDAAGLERHLLRAKGEARAYGMPLYVGEYGIGNGAANNLPWWEDVVAALNRHGVSRAVWEWHSRGTMSITRDDYGFHPYVGILAGG